MRALVITTLLALCACGSDPDVDGYRTAARELAASLDRHTAAINAAADVTACQQELDRYAAEARPEVTRMKTAASTIDDCMESAGMSAEHGAMAPMCESMMSELDRHVARGCSGADMAANCDEVLRHADAMHGLLDSQGMTMGMMSGGRCGM